MLAALTALTLAAVAQSAPDLLQASLQQQYPTVTRWAITPLAPVAPGPAADPGARIVTLGARSAVRVQGHLVWFRVAGYAQAVTAQRAVAAGEALGAAQGVMEERDVVAAACQTLTGVEALEGSRARRSLHPGDIICAAAIEPRPLVARGEEVTVRYVGARILLTVKGVAQSDGQAGQILRVRNPGSRDLFRAVVSGPGEVTIHE